MEMDDLQVMTTGRQHYMMMGISSCPPQPPPPPPPPCDLQYAMLMLGGGGGGGGGMNSAFGSSTNSGLSGGDANDDGDGDGDGDGNLEIDVPGGRWPKEETLALLQIRSRLDSNFKQANNHKAPLWDQISRIMCVEHGYKRSGKKCSEKFENLYKYYKKIKEGKAGRLRDKKHYRFFRQLEAIYGEKNTIDDPNKNNISVSKATTTTLIPPFLEDINDHHCVQKTRSLMVGKKNKIKRSSSSSWITDLIETKVNTLMEKQDIWMEKVMHTIQQKEKERRSKQEQWRKQAEAARFEKQTKFRSNEQAWIESRDLALIEALNKLTNNKSTLLLKDDEEASSCIGAGWEEDEIRQLIQLRSKCGYMEDDDDVVWEEIALRMACLGYNRNAFICKAKWDHINSDLMKKKCSNLYSDHQHNYMIHQAGRGGVALNDQQQNDELGYSRVLMSHPAEIMGNYYGNI